MAPRVSHGHGCRHKPCDGRSQAGAGRAGYRGPSTLETAFRHDMSEGVSCMVMDGNKACGEDHFVAYIDLEI